MYIDLETPLARFSKDCQRHRKAALRDYLAHIEGRPRVYIDLTAVTLSTVMQAVTLANVQNYANQKKAAGAKKASFQVLRQAILFMAEHLAELKCIDYTVVERFRHFSMPNVVSGHRPGIWLSRDQAKALIALTEQHSESSPAQRSRDATILVLMVVGGLRCEEMTKLCWEDISSVGHYVRLRIHGKGRKLRYIKLPMSVQRRIEQWKFFHRELTGKSALFSALYKGSVTVNPLGKRRIFDIVKDAGQRIGMPGLVPHDLRRTSARLAYEAGTPIPLIQQQLGHAQLSTTERYINALLILDNAATDMLATALGASLSEGYELDIPEVIEPEAVIDGELLTRQEAAVYLNLSVPQFDRLRKKAAIVPTSKKRGKTRTFELYTRDAIDRLR